MIVIQVAIIEQDADGNTFDLVIKSGVGLGLNIPYSITNILNFLMLL